MFKFKVLESNQRVMAWIGIHSHRLTEPTNEFFKSVASLYILFTVGFFIFGSIMYVVLNWPHYDAISEPCLIAVGCLQVGGMFLGIGLKMKKIKLLHLRLQEMVDEGNESLFFSPKWKRKTEIVSLGWLSDNGDEIRNIYWNTEQKCRQFTDRFVKFVFINQQMYIAALFFSFYCIIVGNFDTSKWILPFTLWVPFDTTQVHGWYLLWFIQFSMGMSYSSTQTTITSYFVSCAYYIGAICDHFNVLMEKVNYEVEKNQMENDNPAAFDKRSRKIERLLGKAVEIHCRAHEWV